MGWGEEGEGERREEGEEGEEGEDIRALDVKIRGIRW